MAESLLCVAPGCRVPRQHWPSCADGECGGCVPRQAETGTLCSRCLTGANSTLGDIADLHAQLAQLAAGWPEARPANDDASRSLPAGPVSVNSGPRVTGTPGRTAPTSLDALDLLAPPRYGAVVDANADQVGQPSVAGALDSWARDWHECGAGALPDPTVAELCQWLRARLDWAARNHPAVDDFIRECRQLRARLTSATGAREPLPEPCLGVACRKCDRKDLWRRVDKSGVDCQSCGLIFLIDDKRGIDEYAQWVALTAAHAGRAHKAAVNAAMDAHAARDHCCPKCERDVDKRGDAVKVTRVALTAIDGSTARADYSCGCEGVEVDLMERSAA